MLCALEVSFSAFPSSQCVLELQCAITAQVHVGRDSLYQEVEVTNTGSSPFEFTAALHTYFKVSAIEQVPPPPPLLTSWSLGAHGRLRARHPQCLEHDSHEFMECESLCPRSPSVVRFLHYIPLL